MQIVSYIDRAKPDDLARRLVWQAGCLCEWENPGSSFLLRRVAGQTFLDLFKFVHAMDMDRGGVPAPGGRGILEALRHPMGEWLPVSRFMEDLVIIEFQPGEPPRLTDDALSVFQAIGHSFLDSQEQRAFELFQAACSGAGQAGEGWYSVGREIIVSEPVIPAQKLASRIAEWSRDAQSAYDPFWRDNAVSKYDACKRCHYPLPPGGRCRTPFCASLPVSVKHVDIGGRGRQKIIQNFARTFWHAPGVPEIALASDLRGLGAAVEMWPNMDGFDLGVFYRGNFWALDVKDIRSADLLQPPSFRKAPPAASRVIVIPDYRSAKNGSLLADARAKVAGSGIRVMGTKAVIDEIKE